MTGWTIRRAEPQDAAQLAACIEAAYSVYAERGLDLPAVSEGIEHDIDDNIVWVAVLGQRVIGGLILVRQEDHAIVGNVAVAPSATGLGVGRALLDRARHEARELGYGKLRLTTHVGIPENVRLYERLGWRETGRTGSKVHMERHLTD